MPYDKCSFLVNNSYQLIIANINNHKSPHDSKVHDTILSIIDEFFNRNNSLYFIFARQATVNEACVIVYLNIGSQPIAARTFLQ